MFQILDFYISIKNAYHTQQLLLKRRVTLNYFIRLFVAGLQLVLQLLDFYLWIENIKEDLLLNYTLITLWNSWSLFWPCKYFTIVYIFYSGSKHSYLIKPIFLYTSLRADILLISRPSQRLDEILRRKDEDLRSFPFKL